MVNIETAIGPVMINMKFVESVSLKGNTIEFVTSDWGHALRRVPYIAIFETNDKASEFYRLLTANFCAAFSTYDR